MKRLYTLKQAANILQLSERTVRNEIKRGKLQCYTAAGSYRFRAEHLDEYLGGNAPNQDKEEGSPVQR